LVLGLGGSGMGADVVIDLLGDALSVPMNVVKSYHIPAYVSKNTLVIVSSYSGNTEETLSMLTGALAKGAKIVGITSGGKIADLAIEHGFDVVKVPGGNPPRACLGYSFVQQLYILAKLNLISDSFVADLLTGIALLEERQSAIKALAQEIAVKGFDKIPIIYAPDGYASAALRWRQQINENSKMLCWHHVLPEMNHNELVGWRTKSEQWMPIFLDAADVYIRTKYRIEINKKIVGNYTSSCYHIVAEGNNHLERILYLISLGDWVSWYMAQHRAMDAVEVNIIDYLKGELAKV